MGPAWGLILGRWAVGGGRWLSGGQAEVTRAYASTNGGRVGERRLSRERLQPPVGYLIERQRSGSTDAAGDCGILFHRKWKINVRENGH
ncbi:uncharacterized protein K452DRAFT_288600 [Aplosporella prunicola CBS 121167]|uniref:Uncharacterized protein n=1 Tax=Aplosporella prunicola CBS 121167 TaxID=1176127 RepID=A0A6A6BC75_9PEZI|nr:uncharacterized protein K452DRAFT_288600 [Aplosporella prunicola CBS 121167]KAF2140517.1 hypothetical protein K452DRAFT_288600 [Aplosporella prunicola CBS 121167]